MTTLKIVFKTGDKQTVLYAQGIKQMWQVESHVLERLGQIERNALTNARFSKYWIDEDNDRIEIINDIDFEFFIKRSGSLKTPKMYFEAIVGRKQSPNEEPQSTSSSNINEESLSVHPLVECDVCLKAPIRGFRYKCLQCPNFDLCMKCESEMKHPDHLMLRIPNANSPRLETVCPMSGVFGKTARRQQKQAARAAAAANAAALGAEQSAGEGKTRHHRHHRRQYSGLLTNFYDMMQDLAEGGVASQGNTETPKKQSSQEQASAPTPQQPGSPVEQVITSVKLVAETAAKEAATVAASAAAAATAAAAASTAAASNCISKETNTSPDRSSTSSAGAQTSPTAAGIPVTPSYENLIDPQFMKAGIQILNNFSEMFGKILDPVVTEGTSRTSSAPESVVTVDIDLTGENGATATPPPTAAETPNKPGNSKQSSNAASGLVTPMETEILAPTQATVATEVAQPRSRNSQSEENDWTMIDNNVVTISDVPSTSANATAASAATTTPPIDFAKLSQQLQSHIENEMKSVSFEMPSPAASVTPPQVSVPAPVPAPISAPVPAPAPIPAPTPAPAPESTERRAVAVFHADPRINSAVHGMMAMGFSNEGAVLTQLLESVNGSIPLALDLMSAAQNN